MGFFGRGRMSDDKFSSEAVKLSLKKMFKEDAHFSICTIDYCLKVLNIIPSQELYDALHALHCVSWKSMSSKFRNEVYARTLELLEHHEYQGFDLSKIDELGSSQSDRPGEMTYEAPLTIEEN